MDVDHVTWISNILRWIFGLFDEIVYSCIKFVLYGVFDLSQISTNTEIFGGIYQRIYVVLGIFMAFKLSFSFFQYIVNPDQLNGKSDGALSKVFMRTFVMLGALIFLPSLLFGNGSSKGLLSRTQNAFLPMLPRLIFGADSSNGDIFSGDVTKTVDESADKIVAATLGGFFRPAEDLDKVCGPGAYKNTPKIQKLDDFRDNINKTCMVIYYRYKYNFGISTIVGVLILVLFLGITLDIAKRIFKLLILEVIAPIPIMSLIDPKGKDRAFEHWSKSLVNTFLDIFFKLGILYLVIVLIQMIVKANESGGIFEDFPQRDGIRGVYLIVFLIMGLIFFAKEAPKFIKEAMGIKDSGGGLLDDVKSVGKAAGLVGGAAVGTAGIVGSTVGNVRAQMEGNKEFTPGHFLGNSLKNIGAGLSGAVGGTAAALGALTKKDAGIKSVLKAQQDRNSRSFDFRRNGGTFLGGLGEMARGSVTGETSYDALERGWKRAEEAIKADELKLKPLQDANSHRKAIMDRAGSKAKDSDKTTGTYKGISGNYRAYNSTMSAALNAGAGVYDVGGEKYFKFNGQEINLKDAESIGMGLLDENAKDYYSQAYNDHTFDSSIGTSIELFEQETGQSIEDNFGGLKAAFGSNSGEITRRANSINKRKEQIHEERQSARSTRAQANSSKYKAGKK